MNYEELVVVVETIARLEGLKIACCWGPGSIHENPQTSVSLWTMSLKRDAHGLILCCPACTKNGMETLELYEDVVIHDKE